MQFILVHGTFSSNSTWKVFEAELKCSDPAAVVSHWPWTGANAQGGRMEAARRLAEHLNQKKKAQPDQPLVLVGHSHGGNICRAAASYAEPGAVQGIIYVATPHLLFSKSSGRGAVWFLYATLAAITMVIASAGLFVAAAAGVLLNNYVGGSAGTALAYGAYTLALLGLLLSAARILIPRHLRRSRVVRRLARLLLRIRRVAISRNCFSPRSLPELSITTRHDEVYLYLRSLQAASWAYQLVIRAYFLLAGAMFALVAAGMAVIFPVAAIVMFPLLSEPLTTIPVDSLDELRELLTGTFVYALAMPLLMTLMLLMSASIYWQFYGGPWNYGIRFIFDLFFLRVRVAPCLPGSAPRFIAIPLWQGVRALTLLHFAIHRHPATAAAVLDWARTQIVPPCSRQPSAQT